MVFELLFWLGLAVAYYFSYLIFRDLADISQFWLQTPREEVVKTWYKRKSILVFSAIGIAISILTHIQFGSGNYIVLVISAVVWAFNIFVGYFNPGMMMRTQQYNATYVSIEEARSFVTRDYEVMVIENEGVARAHTDYEMWRPHVVGNEKGLNGENVVLTYCAMTNLGLAYRPEIDNAPVDLKVMTQLENNLVMWDKNTGEPIQQMWGRPECSGACGRGMPAYPVFKMPFEKFAKAYPDGEVFHRRRVLVKENPVVAIYDKIWEATFYMAIHRQKQEAAPLFPSLRHTDDRLHTKENIWGFHVGDDFVCYSIPFVQENGNLLNVDVGERAIIVHWDEAYDSLGIWYNDTGTPVTKMDFFGKSDKGTHKRVENVMAGCFYAMWFNFFPQTDVNRITGKAVFTAAA
ncbi:MAG: DUF3179 domain-containing (seleno)protein [Halioglobus sp.]